MPMSVTYATVHGRLVEENRGGVVTEYVPDTLGNVIMTTNESGTVTSTTTYWPFGEVRTQTGTNPSPWGFCGVWGYLTDAVSRMYVRARHYRADTSRWLAVDPLWPVESAYGYVGGRPTLYADPFGLSACYPPRCIDLLFGEGLAKGAEASIDAAVKECLKKYFDQPKKLRECIGKASKGSSIPNDVLEAYLGCMIASCNYTEVRCGTNVCEFQLDVVACCIGMRDACVAMCIKNRDRWDIGFGISSCMRACDRKAELCFVNGDGNEGADNSNPWP